MPETIPNLLSMYTFPALSKEPSKPFSTPLVTRVLASVVVVSHNSRHHLDRCLTSLLHTVGLDCEVIVVDNASTDGSADFVSDRFPWVKLIRNARNAGFAAANNLAVSEAAGHYIVALNPDTEVTPGWLEALLRPFEQDRQGYGCGPPVGMTTPRILMMDRPDRVNTCGNTMHYTGITVCRGLGRPANAPELAVSREVSAVSGACFAMPRRLWVELGGFDPDFFTYLEDTDLSMRAWLAGYRCVYVPDSVVYHSYTGRFNARKFYYLERNRLMLLFKLFSLRTLVVLLPALLAAEAVTWAYALKSGPAHIAAKLRACGWLVAHRTQIARKRRHSFATRRVNDRQLLAAMTSRLDVGQLAGRRASQIADRTLNRAFRLWKKLALRLCVGC
jgi:GT2 family glycosyltransferase